jgi:hypothetical protein
MDRPLTSQGAGRNCSNFVHTVWARRYNTRRSEEWIQSGAIRQWMALSVRRRLFPEVGWPSGRLRKSRVEMGRFRQAARFAVPLAVNGCTTRPIGFPSPVSSVW